MQTRHLAQLSITTPLAWRVAHNTTISCATHRGYSLLRPVNQRPNPSFLDFQHPVSQLPYEWRVADKDHLVERAQVQRTAQHADVLLGVGSIQSSHGFVPKQGLVSDALALLHVVDGDAQVDGFVHQHELPARELVYQAGTVQVLVADLDVEIVHQAAAVRSGTLGPKANLELVVEAAFEQSVDQDRDLGPAAWISQS